MGETKLKRILSLDGGGIRGVLTGKVLEALEDKLNEVYAKKYGAPREKPIRLGEYFDMIAGTSTGGILTCVLLCPSDDDPTYPRFSAKDAVDLYLKNGPNIFKPTLFGRLPGFLEGFGGSKFGDGSIADTLKSYLKEKRLSDLMKPCLITTYDIQERQAVFFTSHEAQKKENKDFLLWEVCRSTSAAPTYFPPASARSGDDFMLHTIDGGLFANNPTMCAFIEALKTFRDDSQKLIPVDRLMIVSIGTGEIKKKYLFEEAVKWGMLKWVKPIIDIMMTGVSETVDYQLRKLFKTIDCSDQYHRIMPDLGNANPEMDDISPKNLEALRQAGIKTADLNDDALDRIAKMLIENH
ncbi:MAG: patatin-like phospholipase family protein [Saprospiraceae bacterium]|nr:patatin-like phospholipase family protein [Saprospiraceae bacterium]